MSRRKRTPEETGEPTQTAEAATPDASDTVTLRLKQNDYVRGKFTKAGKEFPFSKVEADRRMRKTQLWEIA